MRSSRILPVIFILVIALASAAGAAERDVNCWDCNSANLDGLDGIGFGDLEILTTYWLQAEPEVDIIADNNMVDFNDFAIMSRFWQWPCEGITVIFEEPAPGTEIRSQHYLLRATTPDCNVVRAEFCIGFAYRDDEYPYTYYCEPNAVFYPLCDCNTPGQEFACLADFSQDYLVPMDTYLCLKAELFDNEGNSARTYRLVEVDNMIPGSISDLSTSLETASATTERIILTWTAPGDNNMSKRASDYVIKMSDSPIETEEDFESATEVCSSKNPAEPYSSEFCIAGIFDINDPTVHYFRIKTYDDVNNYSMSNMVSCTTTQYYNVSVDSIHYSTENEPNHTNYWYDDVTFWGELTNHWNSVAEALTTFKVHTQIIESRIVHLEPLETKTVYFDWSVNDPAGYHNSSVQIAAQSSQNKNQDSRYKTKNVKVYSIVNDANLGWAHPTDYPIPIEIGNETGDTFYVWVNIYNIAGPSPQNDFYNFTVHLVTDGATLNRTDYANTFPPTPETVNTTDIMYHPIEGNGQRDFWWLLNSGDEGSSYNISVYIGEDPNDRITISRTVRIE